MVVAVNDWCGLTSTSAGLQFRSSRHLMRWCWQVEVRPDGVRCVRRDRSESLAWEDHRRDAYTAALGWWVQPTFVGSRSYEVARVEQLLTHSTPANPHFARYDRSWQLDSGLFLNAAGTEILAALCCYLAVTPDARKGLADPERTTSVIGGLAARRIRGRARSSEPLMGPRLDVWNTVQRVLEQRVRRFYGRRVAGDPMPDLAHLVAEVQAHLPRHLPSESTTTERVRTVLERSFWNIDPWPFDPLVMPLPTPDD